jgi:hypothetical protein
MKWEKMGKIFNPVEHNISQGCSIFAKSPQAIEFKDFVRIYYCAQKRTENNKYLSCPQFVDFNKTFTRILRLSQDPVIELGELGAFDEHGIFPLNVLRHQDRILAYTSGWTRRVSVSIDMAIGLAISENNGKSFKKYGKGGPVMAATYNEPVLVGDPFVQFINGKFHMWYIFGDLWNESPVSSEPERNYKISYAYSLDGINWNRSGGNIIDEKITNECQALPTVFFADGCYHMYFCYRNSFDFRENTANSYRLGYAISEDLCNWQRNDEIAGIDVSKDGWDSEMMCYPNTFNCDGEVYMLYNGNEFGKYGFGLAKLIST